MKQDEYSTARPDAGATGVKQLNPGGQDRASSPSQLNWKLYVGAIIMSKARPAGVQLKRPAKLLTVIWLTTEHAVCRITFMLIPNFFYNEWLFSWIDQENHSDQQKLGIRRAMQKSVLMF